MYYYPFYYYSQNGLDSNYIILDFKRGDVNGDGFLDSIFLIGKKIDPSSPFVTEIKLVIFNCRTYKYTIISPENDAGYNPTLFLGDFTGNKILDIMISLDSGGSGGYAFYYVYTYRGRKYITIFDSDKFYKEYAYEVDYLDYYAVKVTSIKDKKVFIIDIRNKDEDYLSKIYDENGKLKQPTKGAVMPLGGLYPIDFRRNGVYNLYAMQRIIGLYNADGLGLVETSLEWKDREFVSLMQNVAVFGADIK